MDHTKLLALGSIIAVFHILVNAHISKEIHQWVPSLQKRLVLFLCVWFIPVIGIAVAYKTLNLDWFKKKNKSTVSGQSSVSGAFLEVDAIFNPGKKHVVEAQQKEVIEKKEDGEMFNNKPDISELKSTKKTAVL
ncbi:MULTISPECIES: hypothetical protein [Pseudoalteromonas]|uniref:hypothetical protein n=1 Tax=Pseudoalteromonas TaxID=53246 RepID=UPI0007DB2093|nr:hypothetical protein [Pseudoalteromonas neustonica]